jgi:hypothetical protein
MKSQLETVLGVTHENDLYDPLYLQIHDGWNKFAVMFPRLRTLASVLAALTSISNAQDSTPVKPYAQPSGLYDDITQWLSVAAGSQIATCKSKMFANINIEDAAKGTVVASTSTQDPDYHYHCEFSTFRPDIS